MRKPAIRLSPTKKKVYTSMFVVAGVVLPYFTAHGFGISGAILLPMHITVLLCGLLCGLGYGCICGILTPFLSCILTGMPAWYPMLPIMIAELLLYGLFSGLFYKSFRLPLLLALPLAMIMGRAGYGGMYYLLTFLSGGPLKVLTVFGAITTGLPGIALHIVLIPLLMEALDRNARANVYKRGKKAYLLKVAIQKIERKDANCIIIKHNRILCEKKQKGIAGPLEAYNFDRKSLQDSIVVDKVVGKAAAVIFVLSKVKFVYAVTLSRKAKEILEQNGIVVHYSKLVDFILNITRTDKCPIEQSIDDLKDHEQCLEVLKAKASLFPAAG